MVSSLDKLEQFPSINPQLCPVTWGAQGLGQKSITTRWRWVSRRLLGSTA